MSNEGQVTADISDRQSSGRLQQPGFHTSVQNLKAWENASFCHSGMAEAKQTLSHMSYNHGDDENTDSSVTFVNHLKKKPIKRNVISTTFTHQFKIEHDSKHCNYYLCYTH